MTHLDLSSQFKSKSHRVDLKELSKAKRFGRVTTFTALEEILVCAVQNLAGAEEPDLRERARAELGRLLAAS